VALKRLVGNPTYPGIVDDYKRTFEQRGHQGRRVSGAASEMYGMQDKPRSPLGQAGTNRS